MLGDFFIISRKNSGFSIIKLSITIKLENNDFILIASINFSTVNK